MIVWVLLMTVSVGEFQAEVDFVAESPSYCEELKSHAIKAAAEVGAKLTVECVPKVMEAPEEKDKPKKDA